MENTKFCSVDAALCWSSAWIGISRIPASNGRKQPSTNPVHPRSNVRFIKRGQGLTNSVDLLSGPELVRMSIFLGNYVWTIPPHRQSSAAQTVCAIGVRNPMQSGGLADVTLTTCW